MTRRIAAPRPRLPLPPRRSRRTVLAGLAVVGAGALLPGADAFGPAPSWSTA